MGANRFRIFADFIVYILFHWRTTLRRGDINEISRIQSMQCKQLRAYV